MHAIIGCTDHAKDDVRFGRTEIPEQENKYPSGRPTKHKKPFSNWTCKDLECHKL